MTSLVGTDSPVELRDGIWVKREDLYTGPFGVNGSKWRTWQSVVDGRQDLEVVVGASVHAPTMPIAAVACAVAEIPCTVIVGGTTVEKARRHRYVQIAEEAGAELRAIGVGYAPALRKAARTLAAENVGAWVLAPPDPAEAGEADLQAFLDPVAQQVRTLPAEVTDLVIPFGSGNTAAGILYGLSRFPGDTAVQRVHLIGIGPDRLPWLGEILEAAGVDTLDFRETYEMETLQTHPWFAAYGDRMPGQFDGIDLHPTYEGKVVRYLDLLRPDWWTRRDGTTALWIVGGEIR